MTYSQLPFRSSVALESSEHKQQSFNHRREVIHMDNQVQKSSPGHDALVRELWGSLFRGNRLLFCANVALYLTQAIVTLVFAYALKLAFDAVAAGSLALLAQAGQDVAMLVALELATELAMRASLPAFLCRAVSEYRNVAFDRLLCKGIGAFDAGGASAYESALTNDVTTIETTYLEKLFTMVTELVSLVGSVTMLLFQSVPLAAVAIVSALVPLLIGLASGNRLSQRQRTVSDSTGRFVAVVHDLVSGFPLIKSFRAEDAARQRFGAANDALEASKRLRRRTEKGIFALAITAQSISQLAVMFFGAWLALSGGGITVGGILMATQLMNSIAQPIQDLPSIFAARKASLGLVDKLADMLGAAHERTGGNSLPATLSQGIQLSGVTFGYEEGHPVLSDLSAQFGTGGCYAVVGASGSGKSTLLSLLMGVHLDYAGSIAFDGHELRDVSLESLYRTVSLVRQDTFLFDATLRQNITMFAPVSQEALDSVVHQAGLDDFVAQHGLDYPCDEGGSNLSGGERQRACIARSLLHGSKVLLFDEATSALDQKTADQVTHSVLGLTNTTRIMVTHRLDAGQLRQFDGILVLRDGRVCEKGTFQELMSLPDGYFRTLYTLGQ
ncbi:MAG: ABC transporter ATP-binding protein [Atopobiaceae bacterium]